MRQPRNYVALAAQVGTICWITATVTVAGSDPITVVPLAPIDGAAGDHFGISVAISDGLVLVGARNHSDNGIASGAAYLYDASTGQQLMKFLPDDGAAGDWFGRSVALSNGVAIISAPQSNPNGGNSGSAYLFDITTGQQLFKLAPTDGSPADYFGISVAIDGGVAIVGSVFDDDNGADSGSAYLFEIATGLQLHKLLPNDGTTNDQFGRSVGIADGVAIVGSPLDDDNGTNSGSAYLFDVATGQQTRKILPLDGATDDRFGWDVAISDNLVFVGAYLDDDNGTNSGSAYLFDVATGDQLDKYIASDGAVGEEFGFSVALSNGLAIVGARYDDDNGADSGSAYLFDVGKGMQLTKVLPHNGAAGDEFGLMVSVSNGVAVVGAPFNDAYGVDTGAAYLVNPPIPPTIVSSPASVLVGPAPSIVVFEVAADTYTSAIYQWRRDAQPLSNGGNVSGADTPILTINATQSDVGMYDCVVTNTYGSAQSDAAILGVRPSCMGDVNNDGVIDFADFSAILGAYGATCP